MSKRITLMVTESVFEQMSAVAKCLGQKRNDFIKDAIRVRIDEQLQLIPDNIYDFYLEEVRKEMQK